MEELNDAFALAAQEGRTMRWSNFLLTISTNVVPHTYMARINITQWLQSALEELFWSFDNLNGVVIKPAGAPNEDFEQFPEDNLIAGVKAEATIEQGTGRKQMHAHVLIEICHHYTERNRWGLAGVHINRLGIANFFNARIPSMPILQQMRPKSIYINCRLLTKQTDNSSKWLTLAYLNKDRDRSGRDLRHDRAVATQTDRDVRRQFLDDAHILLDSTNGHG